MSEKIECPKCRSDIENLGHVKECGGCDIIIVDVLSIEITKTPKRSIPEHSKLDCPEWVRRAWVGLQVLADPLNDEMGSEYRADRGMAMDVLGNHSGEAAEWYANNLPKNVDFLIFYPDEVRFIEKIGIAFDKGLSGF